MEMGEVEGAMSSLAIVVCGLCTVVGASVFASFCDMDLLKSIDKKKLQI